MADDQTVSDQTDTQTVPSEGDTQLSSSETEPVESTESEEVVEAKPEDEEESAKPEQSERAMSRQQELANKVREKAQEADSLRKQLEEYKSQMQQPTGPEAITPPIAGTPQGDIELTVEDYNRDIMSKADQLVNLRIGQYVTQQAKLSKFEEGVRNLESKYEELNPDSDKFDPDLSSKVTELYRDASNENPDLDVSKFGETVMAIRSKGEINGKLNASKSIAEQEDSSAVAPTAEATKRENSEESLMQKIKSGEISIEEAEKLLK